MPITPLTAPPIDRNRARVDPSCIRRPSAFAAIFAMVTGAFLAGCGKPVEQVAEAAPAPLTEVATHQRWESILIDNGYIFAMDDGLNRYYVHKSDESLLPKFIEANYCVLRDKLDKRLNLDGFKPR